MTEKRIGKGRCKVRCRGGYRVRCSARNKDRREPRKQNRQGKAALAASYTVEAAGVMATVFFIIMILMNQAFRLHGETVGYFALHETVERERHAVENKKEAKVTRRADGNGWELEITAPVFRPENSLRMWSLAEDLP